MRTFEVTIKGNDGYENTLYVPASSEDDAIAQVKTIRRYRENHTITAKPRVVGCRNEKQMMWNMGGRY
jgi:hypothetical protein